MMGYGYGPMADGWGGGLGTIIHLVIVIDLILLGVWLWKQVKK